VRKTKTSEHEKEHNLTLATANDDHDTLLPESELLSWLFDMLLIRRFEEAAEELSLRGKVPGGMHPAIGEEGVAVGVMRALAAGDIVTSTHRSHHHALAKGLPADRVMAELYGKATGVAGGRGGSMHLADFEKGLWGSNGIVGGGLGIAMGSALGAVQMGLDRVSVGFFGDGGANTGRVWEFVNLATIWDLPLIAICENNLYAVETRSKTVTGGTSIADRAAGFGIPAEQVDGQDVLAVFHATRRAVERARSGGGPTFLEMLTYRYQGHNGGEIVTYRTDDEVSEWRTGSDPIDRLVASLTERHALDAEALTEIRARAEATVAKAIEFAEESPWSDPLTASENVSAWNNWNGSQS
jgi:TPP-dependent pyruvate/acetoin dehydrogenase alpha subunit